jgi:dolichyl-phosphate beta-glucosyltransferase
MSENLFLTIVIPAYNEEKNIEGTLKEISEYLIKEAFTYEIIVVDDGSSDKTFESAQSCSSLFSNFKILKNPINKGKGYSVKRGVLEARGNTVLFMDADNSTSIYEFNKFLPYLKEGYDVVIASRRLKSSVVDEPQPFLRAAMGKFFIFLSRALLNLKSKDFNCGFKAYNMKSARFMFELQKMNDWSFDVELLFLIHKFKLKIKEVPVRWVHKSGSKVRPFRDGVRSFLSVIKIRMNDIKHLYDIK